MDLWPGFTFPLILLTACLLLLLWRGHQAGQRSLPPGPRPLPLLGNLPQLWGPSLLGSLRGLRDKYGPVFTIYLGSQRAVVLWGYEAVKEALVDQAEEFGGREGLALVERTSKGNGEEQSGSRRHGSSGRDSASLAADRKPQRHPAPDQSNPKVKSR